MTDNPQASAAHVVQAHSRMHRQYDSEITHESDVDGDRFVCGWCGGWGHVAARGDGRPLTCSECRGLGWYVNDGMGRAYGN